MPGHRASGRAPPPQLLLWVLLLSRAAALHPEELFPYGESRGDQLLPEGDDESSAVRLAVPLRFYDGQFSHLYVSLRARWSPGRGVSWKPLAWERTKESPPPHPDSLPAVTASPRCQSRGATLLGSPDAVT